jgi:glycosyltransferase involved in cell wall biosynthesis
MAGREKIAIITTFQELDPIYSLTGIVKDQVRMLKDYDHEVDVFVSEVFNDKGVDTDINFIKAIPFDHLDDYMSIEEIQKPEHKETINKTALILKTLLQPYDVVFTHDIIYTGWNLLYNLAIREACKELPNIRWLHWIHSVPSGTRDYWEINALGRKHKIAYPNAIDKIRVVEAFKGRIGDVKTIPHIKDFRTWFDFHPDTIEFIKDYPAVMQSNVVQIYPCSVDRLEAKRLDFVMQILGSIKMEQGVSVCLVVATPWANTEEHRRTIEKYKRASTKYGFKVDEDIIFTASWNNRKYDLGLPKQILRDLFTLSNLFIFPTREETFGLVLPEASMSSGCLCVLNKSLMVHAEITGFHSLYFDFGSYSNVHNIINAEDYFKQIGQIVMQRMRANESIRVRTYFRLNNNWDYLYRKYYGPIIQESTLW